MEVKFSLNLNNSIQMRNQHNDLNKRFSLMKLQQIKPLAHENTKDTDTNSPKSDKENYQNG